MEENLASRVSVTVCTLNEEENIEACLTAMAANRPGEIIVVDADSEDRTVGIARRFTDRVFVVGRRGLAYQRQVAVDEARCPYIGIFDADHRLTEGSLHRLVEELQAHGYDGIEAQILSVSNSNYWEWAMEQNFRLSHNIPGPRIMIGTPCIYRTEVLRKVRFDPFFTASSDDTDLCYRLVREGYKLGVGRAIIQQKHRSSFGQVIRKWSWYGKGDAQFFWKHPSRRASIFFHPIRNYMVRRSVLSLLAGRPQLIPFFLLCGLTRHVGFWREVTRMGMAQLLTGQVVDRRIIKT